jgi:hypothetical protein
MLTLSEAKKTDRLDKFIKQQEQLKVGPIDEAEFDKTALIVIKTPLQSGQTSRSLHRDGSPEK